MARVLLYLRPYIAARETPGIGSDIQGAPVPIFDKDMKAGKIIEEKVRMIQQDFRDSFKGLTKKTPRRFFDKWPFKFKTAEEVTKLDLEPEKVVKLLKEKRIMRIFRMPVIFKGERTKREIFKSMFTMRGKSAHRWRDRETGRFVKVIVRDGQEIR